MTSRTFLITFVLLLVISNSTNQPAFAQETSKQGAVKFDEFGDNIFLSYEAARLDDYAMQLINNPSTKGFIIVYRSRRDLPGLSSRTALGIRHYLVDSRGIDSTRLVAMDGGISSCLITELWLVPTGTTPKPRADAEANSLRDEDSTYKFDEFQSPGAFEGEGSYIGSFESELGNLEGYATTLRQHKHALAYIIAYAQYYIVREYNSSGVSTGRESYKQVYLDPPMTAQRVLKTEKDYLVKTYHIAPSRIVLVNGGYRTLRQIELWIVPRGEHAPIATPNAFPKQRAKRRSTRRR